MSRKNSQKRYANTQRENKLSAKKQAKFFALQKNITIFAMLVLLVVGLVSTTFASIITDTTSDEGSLVVDVQNVAISQGSKADIAQTSANVDVAQTSATVTYTAGEYIYLKNFVPSGWGSTTWILSNSYAYAYMWGGTAGTHSYLFELYSGTAGASGAIYRAKVTTGGTYTNVIFTRNSATGGAFSNLWNQTGDLTLSSSKYNCWTGFTASSTSYTGSHYAVAPASVSLTMDGARSGSGTSSSPYVVYVGDTYTLTVSATKSDPGMEGYGLSIGTSSSKEYSGTDSSYTETYTSTSTGTDSYIGYAWNYEYSTSYYSSYINTSALYVKVEDPTYSYKITAGTGGTVSPSSGTVNYSAGGLTITATPSTGYTFYQWQSITNATVASATSASTTFTPTATGATAKAIFRPDAPSALTLAGSNVASGSSGTGTQANPYIVYTDGGFTLTATATVPTGAVAHYSTSASGTYSTTNTFSPTTTTTATTLSYTVYSKSYANSIYSSSNNSATAYYMVFTHLDGANTGFTLSSNDITDIETITLSNAYVNGVDDAEKDYITQTYQISTDNSTFTDITGSTWTPNAVGTYYFRVKTTNTMTTETVYSTSQVVTVTQSTVYYDITVTNDGTVDGTVTLSSNGTEITDGKLLSNSPLTITITRPNSNYYFEYLEYDTLGVELGTNNDIIEYTIYENVKANVDIHYKLSLKPTATVKMPTNAQAITFNYYVDGVSTDVTAAGTYYVDYASTIKYTVAPMQGYYVSAFTGVTLASGSNWSSTSSVGTKANVTANISSVTAIITANKTITVNVNDTSATQDGAILKVDGTTYNFAEAVPLNYGVASTVVITPPNGYYAQVTTTSGVSVAPTISTDGKATFSVTLKGTSSVYSVKFVENPKIYMEQPQYGSIYINDATGRYYFNGDSVGYGTLLTVNVKVDNQSCTLKNVYINGSSIGTTDPSTFNINVDSTATADISIIGGYDNFESTLTFGYRRIFFTDARSWGDDVLAHVSSTAGDTDFSTNNFGMTYHYTNSYNQKVYYCDIPYDKKYVTFFDYSAQSNYSASAEIGNTSNAYYLSDGSTPFVVNTWIHYYSDFVATDRVDTIQQATTYKNQSVTFEYSCDYGDKILSAEVIDGNACTFDFDSGKLIITPTENTKDCSLVKATSAITGTTKYYLIRVDNFEITEFSGIRKIYNSAILNNIQLQTLLNGGVLNYLAEYFVSDTNGSDTYTSLGSTSDFAFSDTLQGYLNNFTLNYAANTMSGIKYYKVTAKDGNGKTASAIQKTLFGTNTHTGERCLYLYNNTNVDVSKYDLRLCFYDTRGNIIWTTMQSVGDTGYYRATIPTGYTNKFNIYLAKKDTFTTSVDDMSLAEYCAYGITNVPVPVTTTDNIVYSVTSINSEGITGEFVNFN